MIHYNGRLYSPFAFFHNPRSSGSSVSECLIRHGGLESKANHHLPIHSTFAYESKYRNLDNHYKFGFCRNPYSREYSFYSLHKTTRKNIERLGIPTFKHYLIKKWVDGVYLDSTSHQYGYFCDTNGKLRVNVFKYEERVKALRDIGEKIKINLNPEYRASPDGDYKHNIGVTPDKHYTEMYDNEMIDLLEPKFRLDMDAFGYTFDGNKEPRQVEFAFKQPDKLAYYFSDYVIVELAAHKYVNK